MAPPKYSDVGKDAADLFSKGFPVGVWKFEAKGIKALGMKMKANSCHNTDNGGILGLLETEFKCSDYGVTVTEKWNTHNVLTTEVSMEDQGLKGLKLAVEGLFSPSTGKKRVLFKTGFKNDFLNCNLDVDALCGPVMTLSSVAGYKGFLGGHQASFDAYKQQLLSNNLVFGFNAADYQMMAKVENGSDFSGSVFHKVNSDLKMGVNVGWSSGGEQTSLGIAAKYDLSSDQTLRAKICNKGQLGLSLEQQLRDGLKMTFASLLDTKNLSNGKHRLGLSVDFES